MACKSCACVSKVCATCRHWETPANKDTWVSFDKDGNEIPYDWSGYDAQCPKLSHTSQVDILLDINGDAYVDTEIWTKGNFGCLLWEEELPK